jgi:hypothetical protein
MPIKFAFDVTIDAHSPELNIRPRRTIWSPALGGKTLQTHIVAK